MGTGRASGAPDGAAPEAVSGATSGTHSDRSTGIQYEQPPVQEILFSEEEIVRRVQELGEAISRDYAGKDLLLVGVLKGVFIFLADLYRAIHIPATIDFMDIASYSPETRDRGMVQLIKDLDADIAGRHVLFVEDVVDTGLTLSYLLRNLRARQPASLEVCTLFDKKRRRLLNLPIKYRGFELPDRFVVGYGLDYREKYRNLPYIGLLAPSVFQSDVTEA